MSTINREKGRLVRILLSVVCILLVFMSAPVFGEEDSVEVLSYLPVDRFDSLHLRIQQFDKSVDFNELKTAFARSRFYDPWTEELEEYRDQMIQALDGGEPAHAAALGYQILLLDFTDIGTHMACEIAFREMKQPEKASYHHWVATSLMETLLSSGDGLTPKTAYHVVSLTEEMIVVHKKAVEFRRSKREQIDDTWYEVVKVIDSERVRMYDIYFNIELPMTRFNDPPEEQ
jgi:hypothetical protein